jgi:hypothetical protein
MMVFIHQYNNVADQIVIVVARYDVNKYICLLVYIYIYLKEDGISWWDVIHHITGDVLITSVASSAAASAGGRMVLIGSTNRLAHVLD